MKLNLFIGIMLLSLGLQAQSEGKDSLATIRKPTLRFLLERHRYAEKLEKDIRVLNLTLDSAKSLIRTQGYQIQVQKSQNSILTQDKIALKEISQMGHALYLKEVKAHNKTEKKWRRKTIVVITLAIVLDAIIIGAAL